MKFVISEAAGAVYWMEVGEVFCAPLRNDDTFDLKEGSLVENWDDAHPQEKARVLAMLAA